MTVISNVFRNEVEELRKVLGSMPKEGCIKNYCNYISQKREAMGPIEAEFVLDLRQNTGKLIVGMMIKSAKKLKVDELVEHLESIYLEGYYGIIDDMDNNGELETMSRFTDADIYEDLVDYMKKTLEDVVARKNKTSEQQDIDNKLFKLKMLENNIESYERNKAQALDDIQAIKNDLAKMQEKKED